MSIRRNMRAAAGNTVKPLLARFGYTIAYDDDYESEAQQIMTAAAPWTMTTRPRLYALWQSVRHIERAGVPGAIVECGVWRGGSMFAAAQTLQQLGVTDRDLYLCDTFEGMTEAGADDVDALGHSATQLMAADESRESAIWARAPLTGVEQLMGSSGYPAERVHYVVGDVRETLPEQAPDQIALLRLDTDWYESTRHELEALYPRLVPGAVLLIDDYGFWQGARKAVDEFLAERGIELLLTRIDSGCRLAIVSR